MANHIAMGAREAIARRYKQGWKKRWNAQWLGLERKTVRQHIGELERSKSPILPAGDAEAKGTISPTGIPGRPSQCEAYRTRIEGSVTRGLTAQRTYQDLKAEEGFTGAYDSVKRCIRLQSKR